MDARDGQSLSAIPRTLASAYGQPNNRLQHDGPAAAILHVDCCMSQLLLTSFLHADGWVLRHYLGRMHIEESFRDDKSGGFDLDSSRLTDLKRLDALFLALAVTVS